jgi:hypothetical protein
MMANDGDFNERMDIIYYEILDTAYDNYSIARFLTENDRSTWNSIINEYISMRGTHIENIVFNFYKTLQTPVKTF